MKKSLCIVAIIAVCFLVITSAVTAVNIGNSYVLTPSDGEDQTRSAKPININTAPAEELMLLPDIGENLANSIIAFREANGPFQSTLDIMRVKGIGDNTYNNISKYITVGG